MDSCTEDENCINVLSPTRTGMKQKIMRDTVKDDHMFPTDTESFNSQRFFNLS